MLRCEGLSLDPWHSCKQVGMAGHAATPVLQRGGQDRIPRACCPARIARSVSCRFSERSHLKEYGGEGLRKTAGVALWPLHTHTPRVHTQTWTARLQEHLLLLQDLVLPLALTWCPTTAVKTHTHISKQTFKNKACSHNPPASVSECWDCRCEPLCPSAQ